MGTAGRYFALLGACWIVVLTLTLYPQFQDTLRVEGRTVAFNDYVEDACGERVGPLAASCRATTVERANRLLASEQAKSLLLIQAPLILYGAILLPLQLLRRRRGS